MRDAAWRSRNKLKLAYEEAPKTELITVSVQDLNVASDIGIYSNEIGRRQILIVNVTVRLDPLHGDHIRNTVDYTKIACLAHALGSERIGLIETFAHRLAAGCLADPLVLEAEVTVRKPEAIPGAMASTRVILRRN